MFLHAHPDDESSKGAGTMAKYAEEGYRVSVVTFTDGCEGEILNPALADQPGILDNIVEVRQKELAEALRILGVTDHVDLGYPDSGWVETFAGTGESTDDALGESCFYNAPMDEVLAKLVPVIRQTRPQVLVTYDEKGGYPHPDHIRTHTATMAAWTAAADPEFMPGAGEPWRASKIYYQMSFTYKRLSLLHVECERRGIKTPFSEWLEKWDTSVPEPVTTSIDVTDHLAQRSAALMAHRTQVDPDGLWFSIPDDLVREVYPYEDFHLAHTTLEGHTPDAENLESDLFAGL